MTIEPEPADLANLIRLSTENTVPGQGDRHYMRLTLAPTVGCGLKMEFECRHEPITNPMSRCTGEIADEFGDNFVEWFDGPNDVEFRQGLIDIWWEDSRDYFGDQDGDLHWSYVKFTRPDRGPRLFEPESIAITEDESTVTITLDKRQVPPVAEYHGNEVSRMLAIGQEEIDRSHGRNVDLCQESYFEHGLLESVSAIRHIRSQV